MITVTLLVLPGSGSEDIQLANGSTIADILARKTELRGRQVVLQGRTIDPTAFASTRLTHGDEVAFTTAVKGA